VARKALSASAWLVAVAAIGLGATHAVIADSFSSVPAITCLVVAVFGIVIGLMAHKAQTSVAALAGLTAAAIFAARIIENDSSSSHSLATESLFLASQILLVLGLVFSIRRRLTGQVANVLADGLIVGIGAWLIVWVYLVQPSLGITGNSASFTTIRSLSLGVAMIVLFLLVTLLFSQTVPSPANAFVGIAIALSLTGLILRAVVSRGDVSFSTATLDSPLLMAVALVGAGFIHPTIRHIAEGGTHTVPPALMTRLLTTTSSLIAPIIILAIDKPANIQDITVRTITACILAAVVMSRVVQSVRQNANTQEQLVKNALTDSLTGLPNRVLMLQHIESAMRSSWKTHLQPTVLFIDVDRFKNINDSLGHSIGDDVLTEVSRRLTSAVPTHATVARIAGDEFVILDTTTESVTHSVLLAERVLDSLRRPIATRDGDMFVTASIGVAYAPTAVELSANELMRHADTAMYRAKNAGRNCIALFDESMLESVTKRLDVETALYRALERNELHLVHQPIVDIDLGIVVGFEALMRWDRGQSQVVSPDEFIPIAEETGIIVPLGSWAINDALTQLRSWIDAGHCSASTTMSVNVSVRQLHDPQFVTVVTEALASSGVPAEQLWLEVTESVMITEPTQALASLHRLNALGVRIAIDDFGTGYSSLSLLQRFPIQCIKIDRAFVNDVVTEPATQNIVRTIIAMAIAMGADVVAEGVENTEQLDQLLSLECHRAQGYLFSRPVHVDDVPRVVKYLEDPNHWREITARS
jgi:diguanylate cyclase (GGDEF)-like protein